MSPHRVEEVQTQRSYSVEVQTQRSYSVEVLDSEEVRCLLPAWRSRLTGGLLQYLLPAPLSTQLHPHPEHSGLDPIGS